MSSCTPDRVEVRPAETQSIEVAGEKLRVLAVEDNGDIAESLKLLLEQLGHEVLVALDGNGALELAARTNPQVMLIDIGLPGMNGYEVARSIRAQPEGSNIVLIALTGYGRDEDKEHSVAAGFDYHLTKPVDVDILQALLVLRRQHSPQGSGTRTGTEDR